MKFGAIKNGTCRSNTGTKSVVFAPDLTVRPVLYAVYSGYQPDRGTVQGAIKGDLVASLVWGTGYSKYSIYHHGGDRLPLGEEAELWATLKRLHPWFDGWLEPQGRGDCFLPAAAVAESDYLCVRAKRARAEAAIRRYGLPSPYTPDLFEQDRKADLQWDPRPLDLDLNQYQPTERYWTGSLVGISSYERWFGSAGDGSPAIPLDIDPEYESGSNYAYSETSRSEGSPGVIGWRNFRFVVRVCHGVHTRNHFSYGHAVDIWEVPND